MRHNPSIFYDSSCTDVAFNDYLLLGGGTDISPNIYGQEDFGFCQRPDTYRDKHNIAAINKYVEMGKPIFGICRGFQLLDAVFGGQLIQHTVGHSSLVPVEVLTEVDGNHATGFDNCRSCHHQVVDSDHTKGKMIGWSDYYYKAYFGLSDEDTRERYIVPQVIYWPKKKALAVQFHPEWHHEDHKMNVYLRGLIKELLGLENVL